MEKGAEWLTEYTEGSTVKILISELDTHRMNTMEAVIFNPVVRKLVVSTNSFTHGGGCRAENGPFNGLLNFMPDVP